MSSILSGYEYDIFISYRHNDNRSGWVTEFVNALQEELAATIKEPLTIYFDKNPHDGLLETHNVDKSLEGKLKSLIFIPIISQTYCDPKSFAWQHEYCAFNRICNQNLPLSSGEGSGVRSFGRDIKLSNGNVASRILPIKIHDLDAEDKATIENEIGGVLRAIEFIYKEAGVNRPLKSTDNKTDNQNKTDYRNQVNKVANAIKELIIALNKQPEESTTQVRSIPSPVRSPANKKVWLYLGATIVGFVALLWGIYPNLLLPANTQPYSELLERADRNLEEASKFQDDRYFTTTLSLCQKILEQDSLNELALSYMAQALNGLGNYDSSKYYFDKILNHYPQSIEGLLARTTWFVTVKRDYAKAIDDIKAIEKLQPDNTDMLSYASGLYLEVNDYEASWKYAKRYETAKGEILYEVLSELYLILGDFKLAEQYLKLRDSKNDFSCYNVEEYQRIYLSAGKFEYLNRFTDSVCLKIKCTQCAYWQLRSRIHTGKLTEAKNFAGAAVRSSSGLMQRLPAYVLLKTGNLDSARVLLEIEDKRADELIQNSNNQFSLAYYSKAAIASLRGEYDNALEWLKKYAEKGFVWGSEWYIIHDPLFDGLKGNTKYNLEFQQIVLKAQAYKITIRERIRSLEETHSNVWY